MKGKEDELELSMLSPELPPNYYSMLYTKQLVFKSLHVLLQEALSKEILREFCTSHGIGGKNGGYENEIFNQAQQR